MEEIERERLGWQDAVKEATMIELTEQGDIPNQNRFRFLYIFC